MVEEFDFQIIANLLAGRGEAREKLEKLKKFLKDNGATFHTLEIIKPTPISQIPKDGNIKINKGIICLGGDGTVSETIGYVLSNGIDTPVAVIPTGTANIIATTLGLGLKKGSFDFLLRGGTKEIDIGRAEYLNEKDYFILGLGLGFEENFLKITKEKLKGKLGIFSYVFAALAELFSLKRIPIKIKADGTEININICSLTILNLQPVILKLFPLFKNEKVKGDDGVLNICHVEYKNFFHALIGTLFFHIFGKKFGLVKEISGKEFFLESPTPVGTQIDGELRGGLPVRISLNPKGSSFLVP